MRTHKHATRTARLALIAALGLLIAGCSNDSPTTSEAADTTVGKSTEGSNPTAGLTLVGLGDSIPGALNCSSPCRSYVEVLGEMAATSLGQPVVAENLATNDSLTSTELLARLKSEDSHINAIRAADAITIQIGFNDWQSTCYWPDHETCVSDGANIVQTNLGLILDEISSIRGNSPAALWVVGYYDNTIGDPNLAANWQLTPADEPAFHAFYSTALSDFNSMMCEVATAHDATCVDLVAAFSGASLNADAGALLGGDHLHPSQSGHELIAETVAATGFAPLA